MRICIRDRSQTRDSSRYSISAEECESFRNLLTSEYEKRRRRSFYPAHLFHGRCPFTFVTSCQETHRDVVRGLHPAPADDVGSVVTLPRKRWRHSGTLRTPIKESRRYPCPFWKKDRRDTRRGWFDSRGSSRHNNFLCSTQIRRLPYLLETDLRTQVKAHLRRLRDRERERW